MHNPIAWLGRCKSDILEKVLNAHLHKVMLKVLGSVTVPFKWDLLQLFHSQLISLEDTKYCWGAHSIYVSKSCGIIKDMIVYFTNSYSNSRLLLFSELVSSPTMKPLLCYSVEDSRIVWVCAINCNKIHTILYNIVRMSSYIELYCCTVW